MAAVPGWPRDLPASHTSEFHEQVCGWLLDRAPGDLRGSTIRQFPLALANLVVQVVAGELEGVRRAYATARIDLRNSLDPDQIAKVQSALESEGARLLGVQREVALVRQALQSNHAPIT